MLTDQLRAKHNFDKQVNGAIVLQVDQAAAERGVRVGDVIVEVTQDPVTSLDDIVKSIDRLKKAGRKAVLLRVERPEGLRFVALAVQ